MCFNFLNGRPLNAKDSMFDINTTSEFPISSFPAKGEPPSFPSQKEINILSAEKSYWRAQFERSKNQNQELIKEIEALKAKLALREKQLFGKKGEKGKKNSSTKGDKKGKRGKKKGTKGHGRRIHKDLPVIEKEYDLSEDEKYCKTCGLYFNEFPGTEDSEEVEYEVRIYRKVHKRKKYTPTCRCGCNPGIITAKGPDKLIPGGGYAISFWIKALLDKYRWQTPTNRLRQELEKFQLFVSQGTITGGFKFISGLLKPIEEEIINQNKSETHWHCDETRWMVFVNMPDKKNHKWYLWIYQSATSVVFSLVPSRGAKVPKKHFNKASGIISADRYVAYKCLIKSGNFLVAFCWAHVRRDFLDLAVKWIQLETWALIWVDKIAELYHINNQRLEVSIDSPEFMELDLNLRGLIEQMENHYKQELSKPNLHEASKAVLNSLKNHWDGLTLFLDYPWIPMDNNIAERGLRNPIMGRKSYYGSGALWSAELTARTLTINQTLELWGINLYLWYDAYLKECSKSKGEPPQNVKSFLPWNMTDQQLIAFGADPAKVPIPPPKINKDIFAKKQNREGPLHIKPHTVTEMDMTFY